MPYRIRKAPNRDLYWVVGEDGKHHSKDPIPLEKAKKQMAALYIAMKGGEYPVPEPEGPMYFDTVQGTAYNAKQAGEYAAMASDPLKRDRWNKEEKRYGRSASDKDYEAHLKLVADVQAKRLAFNPTYTPAELAEQKKRDYEVAKYQEKRKKWQEGADAYYAQHPDEKMVIPPLDRNGNKITLSQEEWRKLPKITQGEAQRRVNVFREKNKSGWQKFSEGATNFLTGITDKAVGLVGDVVPGYGKALEVGYKTFAPPGSEYHKDSSFQDKLMSDLPGNIASAYGAGKKKSLKGRGQGLPKPAGGDGGLWEHYHELRDRLKGGGKALQEDMDRRYEAAAAAVAAAAPGAVGGIVDDFIRRQTVYVMNIEDDWNYADHGAAVHSAADYAAYGAAPPPPRGPRRGESGPLTAAEEALENRLYNGDPVVRDNARAALPTVRIGQWVDGVTHSDLRIGQIGWLQIPHGNPPVQYQVFSNRGRAAIMSQAHPASLIGQAPITGWIRVRFVGAGGGGRVSPPKLHKDNLLVGSGIPENSLLHKMATASYSPNPPQVLEGYKLVGATPTLKFYQSTTGPEIVVGIRGTKEYRDVATWPTIPFNSLASTDRFKDDLQTLLRFQKDHPVNQYEYFGVGHSLGGAILDQFIKMGLIRKGVSYNPAIQSEDVRSNIPNHRIYRQGDPLYSVMGQFSPSPELRTKSFWETLLSYINPFDSYYSHKLSNFVGGRRPATKFQNQLKRAKVSPEAYLKAAQACAKKQGLAWKHLGFSSDDTHKLQIPNAQGKVVRFGSVGLGDHILYTLSHDESADEHRKRYLARATKIKGDWKSDQYSPNSLAIHVLWGGRY